MTELKSLPRYGEYKDSGVEWIEKRPSHWCPMKLKFLLKEVNERSDTGKEELLSLSKYKGVVKKSSLEERAGQAESLIGYKKVKAGQLVINKMQAVNGLLSVSKIDGITSPDYSVYKESDINNLNISYLDYLLSQPELLGEFKKRVTGVMEGFIRLYTDDLYDIKITLPTITEQTAIANYLDKKAAKIDQAIAIKEKQIALLKERKQTIIQNAITRGLNPDAPMRESGVEWIGKIPEHWKMRRLKFVVKIKKRIIRHEGPDVLSITQQGIKIKDIESGEGQLAMDYSKYQILNKGEFAMNHMDLLTGYVDISQYYGVVSPDYRVFVNVSRDISDKYLLGMFQMGYQQKIFYRYGQGVSLLGRWRLPADNFNNFYMPIPPDSEQEMIMKYIETESVKVEAGIHLQEKQIKKLKEYKTILINSAVTGKIKVPGVDEKQVA